MSTTRYVDLLAEYLWYMEIGDRSKADEIADMVNDIGSFNTACSAIYPAASIAGKCSYTFLILERASWSSQSQEMDYAALLQYCQLWDIGEFDEALDFIHDFGTSVQTLLYNFLSKVDSNKLLTPQLTILRG